jgi:hypothetical protein
MCSISCEGPPDGSGGLDGVSLEATIQPIFNWFREQNFQLTYRSTAIYLLAHPELPGVEVRIGTVYTVVERDGHEIYRTLHREFDQAIAHDRIFGPRS